MKFSGLKVVSVNTGYVRVQGAWWRASIIVNGAGFDLEEQYYSAAAAKQAMHEKVVWLRRVLMINPQRGCAE